MNHLSMLLAGLVHDLGWTLVHFLWQGLILAAILQAILPMCRDAAQRHNWALGTLAAMLLAPVATFLFIHAGSGQGPAEMAGRALSGVAGDGAVLLPAPIPGRWINQVVALWLAGVFLLTLRALGGWYLIECWWRRDAIALDGPLLQRFRELQHRLAIRRPIMFLQSCRINAPVVIGWFRPVILIPFSAIMGLSPQQLDGLIVHELAHIRRADTFTNLMLIFAETFLFYHPAVWWVGRRVRTEREHCCDDFAVGFCGDAAVYVEALTSLKTSRGMPSLVLAAGGGRLKERVARLLDMPSPSRKMSPSAVIGFLFLGAIAASAATARSSEPGAMPVRRAVSAAEMGTAAQKTRPSPAADDRAPAPVYARLRLKKRHVAAREFFGPLPQPDLPTESISAEMEANAIDNQTSRDAALPSVAPALPAAMDFTPGIESIVVTAQKWLGEEPLAAIRDFVNSYTNPATLTVGEITRWKGAICARTYGLARAEDEDFVTRRLEDIAADAGLEVKNAPCHYGIEIVFTATPQAFLDKVRAANASLLGSKPSQAEASPMRFPVQAWYATATRDLFGRLMLDNDDAAGFGPVLHSNVSQTLSIFSGVPLYNTGGFRLQAGLNSELAHIYVVADTSKLEGYPLAAVADYVSVLALSQTQNFAACRPMPSITNLVSPDCRADLKAEALTDTDLAYLKAVYTMDPGASLQRQRAYIADRIALALGVK